MVRTIGQSPTQQQQHSTTTTTEVSTPTTTQASPGIGTGTGTGPVATSAVEFLDAEAETALFLDSMHSSSNINSLASSPLPLALPWSPSQDMIWAEDEILAGGLGIGGNGSQQSVDMTLADDIGVAEMVDMGLPGQELDDGRGVLMEEDEILPVVVVETVVAPPQPVSPVLGFGLGQRLQQHQQQHHQQQQGGVRFNPAQQNNSTSSSGNINNLNRIKTFGKVEGLTPRRTSTAGLLSAVAQRNGVEKSRPPPPPPSGPPTVQREDGARAGAGTEVGRGGVSQGGTTIAAAAEEEKPGDMEIDTPEVALTSTTGTRLELASVQDVQSTSLRENQGSAEQSASSLSQPIVTSVLAPALELKSAEAPSESMLGTRPAVAIGPRTESPAVMGADSTAQPVAVKMEVTESAVAGPASAAAVAQPGAESMVIDPATAESDGTETTTEPIVLDQPPSASQLAPITPLATDEPKQSIDATTPTSPSSSLSTNPIKPTKPPKNRRRPPIPVQHHPSWHFAPGSDMAFLSEMKGSDADLKRFRREHEWLEERVRRPKRDHTSDQLLDKALGLTRMVVVPPSLSKGYGEIRDGEEMKKDMKVVLSRKGPAEGHDNKDGGEEKKGEKDTTTNSVATTNTQNNNKYITPVRLSTDSRLAFSILKTNLSAELEEQARLETDQRILEQIVERAATKLSTIAQLHSQAEERLRELQTKQPDQERELSKMEKLERACIELRDRQRQQAEEEIRQLEETVRLLESQQEQKRKEDLRRAERQRSEMERVVASSSPTASSATAAH
ncbi:hypothetical protein BG015_002293 [Linnemannia schmuckeri]|uniref:Uncharacterized protein n=1 Tax=Linnemannia schmuckeri TaxID=64567 RepID=A0A9P5S6P1_9FUNG|nr:hypothetical protein BG015_002293 [Linnemannia schmuckeri]